MRYNKKIILFLSAFFSILLIKAQEIKVKQFDYTPSTIKFESSSSYIFVLLNTPTCSACVKALVSSLRKLKLENTSINFIYVENNLPQASILKNSFNKFTSPLKAAHFYYEYNSKELPGIEITDFKNNNEVFNIVTPPCVILVNKDRILFCDYSTIYNQSNTVSISKEFKKLLKENNR